MSQAATPTMSELKCQIGELFLEWGFLENELKARHGDVSSLATRPDLQDARRIRNLIAHGIVRATAVPEEGTYLTCISQLGVEERVTFAELCAAAEAARRARWGL